jgi:hypothetical protein
MTNKRKGKKNLYFEELVVLSKGLGGLVVPVVKTLGLDSYRIPKKNWMITYMVIFAGLRIPLLDAP